METATSPTLEVTAGAGEATYGRAWPVRDDLASAHLRTLEHWSSPGTWLTGEQRVEVVRQVRAARDAVPTPPPWAKPSAEDGGRAPAGGAAGATGVALAPELVDAIWRLTNHPGTLTADWYEGLVGAGVEPLVWVEVVGLVAQASNVDTFADGLGLERLELPAPVAGEPSREVPDGAAVTSHWVPTAAKAWANVVKALSAVPAEVDAWMILSDAGYVPMEWVRGVLTSDRNSLNRLQIELLAARTSKLNECFY